jgi:pyruvate dehydrogenase E1 component
VAFSTGVEWLEAVDPASGRTYWFNPVSHETSWTAPVAAAVLKPEDRSFAVLAALEKRAIWLCAYSIYHANMVRPNRDGVKVGGHQASSSSLATVLTALYFKGLRPQDRVAVKPHAGPIFHAIQYMCGKQSVEKLQGLRSFGGAQSYPSITKDDIDVDYSTGSVGLGAAATLFGAIFQDYLIGRGLAPLPIPGSGGAVPSEAPARYIALVGDAELDEGNVYEAVGVHARHGSASLHRLTPPLPAHPSQLYEGNKQELRNNWWFIDYNRQSLDRMSPDGSWRGIDKMFRANGWRVITLKYGAKLERAFDVAGPQLRRWLNETSNDAFGVLSSGGGAEFRAHLLGWIARETASSSTIVRPQLEQLQRWLGGADDNSLLETVTNLGGHDMVTVLKAIDLASKDDIPTCFICYTIKGHGLGPVAGHRDNHGMQMNSTQVRLPVIRRPYSNILTPTTAFSLVVIASHQCFDSLRWVSSASVQV